MDTHAIATEQTRLAHSINEAAQLLSISRRTLYDLLAEGRLRSVKIGARRLIPHAELERLLAEGSEGMSSASAKCPK